MRTFIELLVWLVAFVVLVRFLGWLVGWLLDRFTMVK